MNRQQSNRIFQPSIFLPPFLQRLTQERFTLNCKENPKKLGDRNCSQEFLIPVLPPGYPLMPPYGFPYNFSYDSYLQLNQQSVTPSSAIPCTIYPPSRETPSNHVELETGSLKRGKKTHIKSKPIYRRNIFKSILRNMRKYAKKDKNSITEKLKKKGYSETGIEQAFFIINNYKTVEDQRGNRQKYRKQLDLIAAEKSILTIILKDSLKSKIDKLEAGNHGRIALSNYKVYKKAYVDLYTRVDRILEEGGMQLT